MLIQFLSNYQSEIKLSDIEIPDKNALAYLSRKA